MLRTVLIVSLALLLVGSAGQAGVWAESSPADAGGLAMPDLEVGLGDLDILLPSQEQISAASDGAKTAPERWIDLVGSDDSTFWADMMSASAFGYRALGSLHSATRSLWPHSIDPPADRSATEGLLWQFYDRGGEDTGVSSEELQSEAWMWVSSGLYRADETEIASSMEVFRQQTQTR